MAARTAGRLPSSLGESSPEHVLLISFYSQKTKEWSEVKISFTNLSRHIYLPSIGWEWERAYAFPYLGQVPLPRWASPRWAQEFRNHRNMVGRAIKSPVGGVTVTLTLFQAGSSFVLEAPLSLEHHTRHGEGGRLLQKSDLK